MITLWWLFLPPVTIFGSFQISTARFYYFYHQEKLYSSPSLTPLPYPHSLYPHHHQVMFQLQPCLSLWVAAVKMLMGRKGTRGCVRNVFFFFSIVILHLTLKKLFSLFSHICAGLTYNRGAPREFLNINVRLKLHPIALHTGSEPTRIINVLSSFIQTALHN